METFPKPDTFGRIPTATGVIARLACARMREVGKDCSAILSKTGLTFEAIADPAVRVDLSAQIALLELAAEELQDELLGFHLASTFDLREAGLVYYVMASSERLGEALRNCERYSHINNDGIRLRFGLDQAAVIALEHVNVDRWSDRQHLEFWFVGLVRICRQITNTRLAPDRVKLRHHRHSVPAEFRSFFGVDVEFGADADEIIFSRRTASFLLADRDPYLNNLLRRYAEAALANRPTLGHGIRPQVEHVLPDLLPHGKAHAAEVARRLGMSSRTLSRKLKGENATFAEILDELRGNLARRYLSDDELPVSQVAWLLGYGEVSSLTNAFKRWTGISPRQFRSSVKSAPLDR